MNILVIGGTRLLGLAVVQRLVAQGHRVTVISRRAAFSSPGVTHIGLDRAVGLAGLGDETFDVAIDFLGYDGASVAEALTRIRKALYVMISSTWMTRLRPGIGVDEPIETVDQHAVDRLPAVTRRYLSGKREGEACVLAAREAGREASVVRLPIFLGDGDHTGRVEFYRERIVDGGGVLCVDGGHNTTQIAWTEDLAHALVDWLPTGAGEAIWEGLPDRGLPVREVITHIAGGAARSPSLRNVPAALLAERLPAYLDHEPLWREAALAPSTRNIFAATGVRPTAPAEWLGRIRGAPDQSAHGLRTQELVLIEQL
jgi:nucleoside-diphosphate-sugar epimerase